jgi:type II secretory pathway pseudopilin PulG
VHRRLIAVALVVIASAALFANLAWATGGGAQEEFDRACGAALTTLQNAVYNAATTQVQTIAIQLELPKRGLVTGAIAFNPTGDELRVAGDASDHVSAFGVGCTSGSSSLRLGRSYKVSTLRKRLKPGTYTLTFKLNATGRRILARLGVRQRAYAKRHPSGQDAPTIAYGVGLGYTPTG